MYMSLCIYIYIYIYMNIREKKIYIYIYLTLVLAERTVDQIAKADAKGSRATFSQHCNMAQMAVCG